MIFDKDMINIPQSIYPIGFLALLTIFFDFPVKTP